MIIRFSTSTAFAVLAATVALANGGSLEVYDGVIPASGDDPITTQVLLVTLTLDDPAYQDPTDAGFAARAVANPITGGVPNVDGTAAWYCLRDAGGGVVWFGDCGPVGSGASMEMDSLTLTTGQPITVTLGEHYQPKE